MRDDESDFDAVESLEETNDAETYRPGHVYFLSLVDQADPARDFGLVKVGFTTSDVEKRIAQLQTGNPYQIRCEFSFPSPVARHVENWLHRSSATRGYQLEWLKLVRSDIPGLVEAAKRESERFASIADAMMRWVKSESNGRERQPSAQEQRLHDLARREVLPKLSLARARLENTRISIALKAGKVLRIPGIVKTSRIPASRRFNRNIVLDKFRTLAADHVAQEVRGAFSWRGVRNDGSSNWTSLRTERACRKTKRHELDELNTAMLYAWDGAQPEGERTNDLARLHDEYLKLIEQEARLALDAQDIRAQMTQAIEDCEIITGVCSFRRSLARVLDSMSFREAHEKEAAECFSACNASIRREIYLSRSY